MILMWGGGGGEEGRMCGGLIGWIWISESCVSFFFLLSFLGAGEVGMVRREGKGRKGREGKEGKGSMRGV